MTEKTKETWIWSNKTALSNLPVA